jgi:hypothetical protein
MLIPSIAIAIASALVLAACSKTVDTACTAFQPITYSAAYDTPETATQVRQHNAAWTALCK